MLKTISEGYLIMIYFLLHFTILACDHTCAVPIKPLADLVPQAAYRLAYQMIAILGLSAKHAGMLGQLLFLGDFFIILLLVCKICFFTIQRFFKVAFWLALIAFSIKLIAGV
jgi:hypothetical protein